CPTSCILSNRTIDASRCISYLTIELKSEIPEELRALIGDWVFGCDVCQQVCPWNQPFSTHKKQSIFGGSTSASYPDLDESLSLTTEKFNRLFKGSAVKRTKRRGYLRNIAVAAGNQGSPNLVKSLVNAMQDSESLVRRHVAWALGQIGGDEALDVLRIAAQKETDEQVLDEINNALETCFERS
ncbi:MAG: HEAT repeat domain-containing protein, partial [Anaerolineales bacterium]|nr:HEAT repeat domain-containing protein [Anaerolineales bacterium]